MKNKNLESLKNENLFKLDCGNSVFGGNTSSPSNTAISNTVNYVGNCWFSDKDYGDGSTRNISDLAGGCNPKNP